MKKLILMAVVAAAFAACGGKADGASTLPADNTGGDTGGDTYGGDTGGDSYGGDMYGDMDEGGM